MNLQATLFDSKIMRSIKAKKPKRVYGINDVFPYGVWKGQRLSVVALIDPTIVEHWLRTNKAHVSAELLNLITHAKFLAKWNV